MANAADESPTVRVETVGRLSGDELAAVTWLVEHATESDGVRPLSEHVLLNLRYGGGHGSRSVLLYAPDGPLAAYAHLDLSDPVAGASAELVVDPAFRRRGYGRTVVAELQSQTAATGGLRLWAHGRHPAAARLATTLGFSTVRSLLQLRRPLGPSLPDAPVPAGVRLRPFRPGADDERWLALNALAFAGHPEQGALTASDLDQRMAEPWFDARGFLLAERSDAAGDRLVGFHWTKVHGDGGHGHEPIGEVYVIGVVPEEQGIGLGKALIVAGLRHLRALGLASALLYVEAENAPAVGLYTKLGFTTFDTDVMYGWPNAAS